MKHIIVRMTGALALLAMAVVFGIPSSPPKAAHADPQELMLINSGICTALTKSSTFTSAGCTIFPLGGLDYSSTGGDAALLAVANNQGKHLPTNTVISPTDFTNLATFSGGQVHQADGGGASLSTFAILAFVRGVGAVTFNTTAGRFLESGTQTYRCDGLGTYPDSDCGGPNVTNPNPTFAPDHVVVAYIQCTLVTCPTLGPQTITVEQFGIIEPLPFTVVGEPRTVQFFTLEKAIQAGVPVTGTLTNRPPPAGPGCIFPDCIAPTNPAVPPYESVSTACPFSASVSFVTKALAQAEKTVIVARALDINGTSIAGAWVDWTVDNNGVPVDGQNFATDGVTPTNFDKQGILAQPYTPTLNLGGFGYGAPNILCAPSTAVAGKVTVRATLTQMIPGGITADFGATGGFSETSFNVSPAPVSMTLSAAPASIPCDGTTTSTVSAAVTDADGTPALSGTAVNFYSPILGTANPIDTTTNDKGIATTTITPLSGVTSGVTVTVTPFVGGFPQLNLMQSILVACNGATTPGGAAPGGAAPGGAPGAAGTAPVGITAPNTGSGPLGASGPGSLTWWPALALAGAALALAGTRRALKRVR